MRKLVSTRRIECMAFLLFLFGFSSQGQNAKRPNILLIMADDMGYGDIGMGGNPIIKTPSLDKLAKESVDFSNFYVSPVCAPTRASLLTGRYAQRAGVLSVTNGYETLDPEAVTLAEMLSSNGYRTGLFGKWHLGENYPSLPNAQGFGEFVGFRTGHFDNYFDPRLERNGEPYPTQGYITDVLTTEAIRFMEKNTNSEPFLCYLPYNAPHTPLDVPEEYLKRYRDKGLNERVERVYAMVENLDTNIGRLMDFLSSSEIGKNTIVMFLSDNGPIDGFRAKREEWRFNAGLRDQKFTVYEGGIRTRFFARWPGHFVDGKHIETIAAHIDVMPTLLGLCGVRIPDSLRLDGRDLSPLLTKPAPSWPSRTLFLNYSLSTLGNPAPYPGGIARTQRYKMVDGKELYDLVQDPGEAHNLADELPQELVKLDKAYRVLVGRGISNWGVKILPIAVGYDKARTVRLAPHLGRVTGELEYTGFRGLYGKERIGVHPNGVDGDWIANWRKATDKLTWRIRVVEEANYTLSINMRSKPQSPRPEVRLTVGEKKLEREVPPADEPLGSWALVPWGEMYLKPGEYELSVQAMSVPSGEVMDLGSVELRKERASGR